MNTHIRDNQLAEDYHLIARRTANQSVTSSTALVNDDTLQLTVGTNEVWLFRFVLRYDGASTGDIKIAFSMPASATVDATPSVMSGTAGTFTDSAWSGVVTDGSPQSFLCSGAGTTRMNIIDGVYIGAGTAGTLILRWAQNASDATATRMLTHSTLWAVKLA